MNFELQSDFVTEFARSAVKPINQFSTDLGHALPSKIGEDINVQIPPNVKVKLQTLLDGEESSGSTLSKMMASLDYDSHIMMDVDEFIPYFRQELLKSGQSPAKLNRSIQKIRIELEQTNREITENQ